MSYTFLNFAIMSSLNDLFNYYFFFRQQQRVNRKYNTYYVVDIVLTSFLKLLWYACHSNFYAKFQLLTIYCNTNNNNNNYLYLYNKPHPVFS